MIFDPINKACINLILLCYNNLFSGACDRCVANEQTLKINTLFSEKVRDKSKYIYYIIHIHYIIIYDIILYYILL